MLGFDTVARDLGFTEQQARSMQGFASAAIVATAVPEPESWLLLAAGGGMLGWVARRRRQATTPEEMVVPA